MGLISSLLNLVLYPLQQVQRLIRYLLTRLTSLSIKSGQAQAQTKQTPRSKGSVSQPTRSKQTKTTQGRPTQIYVQRLPTEVKVTLWPVPDTTTTYTLLYYRLKGIDGLSSGIGGNVTSVPPRFVPALVSGLAYYIAMKKPDVAARAPALKQEYEFQFQLASGEDEETASIKFVPFDTFMVGG